MASEEVQKLLKQFFANKVPIIPMPPSLPNMPTTSPGAQDFATYLLLHATNNKKAANALGTSIASRESADNQKTGVMSNLLDMLSAPLYGASTMLRKETENAGDLAATVGNKLGIDVHGVPGASYQPDIHSNILADIGKALSIPIKSAAGAAASEYTSITKNPILDTLAGPLGDLAGKIPGVQSVNKGISNFADQNVQKGGSQQTLNEVFGVKNPVARYGGGLALDLVSDPLSYVGMGFAGKVGDIEKTGKSIRNVLDVKATEEANTGGLSQLRKPPTPEIPKSPPTADVAVSRQMIPRSPMEANPVPEIPRQDIASLVPDTPAAPLRTSRGTFTTQDQMASDVADGIEQVPTAARTATQKIMRADADWQRAMKTVGQVADTSGKISLPNATAVVKSIVEGKIPHTVPVPPSATGELAIKADGIAEKTIDELMGPKRSTLGQFAKRSQIKEVRPGQQITLFNRILQDDAITSKNPKTALAMLRSAEDHMIALKVQPIWHNGQRIRLSEVINTLDNRLPISTILKNFAMTDMNKMNPLVRATITGLASNRAFNMSEVLANLTQTATQAAKDVTLNYVGKAAAAADKTIMDDAISHAIDMGMTKNEANAVAKLIKNAVDLNKLPTERWVEAANDELMKAMKENRINPDLINKFNQAVAGIIGNYHELGKQTFGARTVNGFMYHIATWWKKGDLQNYKNDVFTWGEQNAAAREATMRGISMSYSQEEISNAWKVAAGVIDPATDRSAELSKFFAGYMNEVTKLKKATVEATNQALGGTSVAERAQMTMEDINSALKDLNGTNAFQFTNSKHARDMIGTIHDFSEDTGTGWLTSWSAYEPTDPVSFIYDLDLAVQRVANEYAFLDDFAGRSGVLHRGAESLRKNSEYTFKVAHPRLKDFRFRPEVGQEMNRVLKDLHRGMYRPNSALLRFYGKGLRIWKTSVTIYLPSFHIRNGIGDSYLMWLAGHNNPIAFIWAKRIMHSQRGRYKALMQAGDFEGLGQLTDPHALEWAMTKGGDTIVRQNGVNVTAEQFYVAAHRYGLLRNYNIQEDLFGEAPLGKISASNTQFKKFLAQPLGGHLHTPATTANEYREHFIRLAHFTSAVSKRLKVAKNPDMEKIFQDAAHEVRKWHPDGSDLTITEQKLRYLIPFYSWLRKSTPLLVQGAVQRPAKLLAQPRGMVALQNMLGINTSVANPFPQDQLFPDWILSYGVGPIGDPESNNIVARWFGNLGRTMNNQFGNYGYTEVNPSNPSLDFAQQYLGTGPQDTGKGILSALSPFVNVPYQLASDRTFTGAPISKTAGGQGLGKYLLTQIPQTSPAQRVFNIGDKQKTGSNDGRFDLEALLNILTAGGIHGTGPYIKEAQYEQKAARP